MQDELRHGGYVMCAHAQMKQRGTGALSLLAYAQRAPARNRLVVMQSPGA